MVVGIALGRSSLDVVIIFLVVLVDLVFTVLFFFVGGG